MTPGTSPTRASTTDYGDQAEQHRASRRGTPEPHSHRSAHALAARQAVSGMAGSAEERRIRGWRQGAESAGRPARMRLISRDR